MAALRAPVPTEQDSVGSLVGRLSADVGRVVRAEIALLQLRVSAATAVLRAAGGGLVAGIVLALGATGAIVAGLVLVVAHWLPAWGAAFAVGGALLAIATVVTLVGARSITHGLGEAMAPADRLAQIEESPGGQ